MRLIVIEGLDGSGKSTQIRLLSEYLTRSGIPFRYLHFPRTDSGIYGNLIARFLRGDMGQIGMVDPYLVALIYAGDRHDAAPLISGWLHDGYTVILDRYVYSNVAFQCAKVEGVEDQVKLRDWILHLEFTHHNIPRPEINILLDVPFSFTSSKLTGMRQGDDRGYLNGRQDIHEQDLAFQQRVRNTYLWQAETCNDLKVIGCSGGDGSMLPPNEIFDNIRAVLNL